MGTSLDMLSLRGHAPCRSLLTPSCCRSARASCSSFKHTAPRHSLHVSRQAPVRTPCFCAPDSTSTDRTAVSCSAQPDFEEHIPEVVDDSDSPLHLSMHQEDANAQHLQAASGPQRLASWALGHQQKGITTLLGVAGVALAGIAGGHKVGICLLALKISVCLLKFSACLFVGAV